MTRRLNIGIAGPFSDINFGDYGMLVNNVYDLGEHHTYTLFSYNSEFLKTIINDYFSSYAVKQYVVEPSWFGNCASVLHRALTPNEVLENSFAREALQRMIEPLDVILINGGGYFNELWAQPHRQERLLSIISVALVAQQLRKRIIFTANGFGPFKESREFFENILNSLTSAAFYCRDDLYSPATLRSLGMMPERIRQAPDDLHLLNDRIGLNSSLSFITPSEPYILMETYLPIDEISDRIEEFTNFVRIMDKKYSMRTIFVPLNLGAGGADQARLLQSKIPALSSVDISEKGYLPLEDARNLFKNAAMTLCSRYHSLVFSASLGTPVLSVVRDVSGDGRYYYNKNSGFLRKMLKNIVYQEIDYMEGNYFSAMKRIIEEFPKLYNSQKLQLQRGMEENGDWLRSSRYEMLDYIRDNPNGCDENV